MAHATIRRWHKGAVVSLLLLSSLTAFGSEQRGSSGRPPAVPNEFLVTPNGYFHPSCVQHVDSNEVVDTDSKWITKQGFPTRKLACQYSHYDADGREITAKNTFPLAPPPAQCPNPNSPCGGGGGSAPSSWVIWDSVDLQNPVGTFWQTMIVPNAPAVQSGQVLFLFPGIQQSTTSGLTILQPVLAWNGVWPVNGVNQGYANQWEIVSWNCCYNGVEVFSTPVAVNPGDIVQGEVQSVNCNGSGYCNFNVDTYDQVTRRSSYLAATSGHNQIFSGLFGAVLEVYFVGSCNEYPSNNAIFGYNPNNSLYGPPFALIESVAGARWTYTEPSWVTTVNRSTAAPSCGYTSSPYNGGAQLTY